MKTSIETMPNVRDYNVGNSDYAKHKIQPWDIWLEYRLNPFDADLVKRTLRTKTEQGMTRSEARRLDYEKIIHISAERIRQLNMGIEWPVADIEHYANRIDDIIGEYGLCRGDANIIRLLLEAEREPLSRIAQYESVVECAKVRIDELNRAIAS